MVHPERVGDFQRIVTPQGHEVYLWPTRKFKTTTVRVHFRAPLGDGSCARSLVPDLLRRGTRKHPSLASLSRALESLYGAYFSSSTYKLGLSQLVSFRMEFVDPRFVPEAPDLGERSLELLRDVLLDPVLEGGAFPPGAFEHERLNLRREIEAQYNDKHTYATQRLLEEMFPEDPYGRPVQGTVADVDRLTAKATFAAWREIVAGLPARVFVVGNVHPERCVSWIAANLPLRARAAELPSFEPPAFAASPRLVVEEDRVSQSKLILGHRVDLTGMDERAFDALRVYSCVLGGGFHSRLFRSVRETHSLAYYASASLDRIKGVLTTSFGIDAARRQKVCDLAAHEMESLREAPPTAEELGQSVKLLVSSSETLIDSASGVVDVFEGGLAAGMVRSLAQLTAGLGRVTDQDVMAAARRIGPPEVIYCLQGEALHDAG